MGAAKDFMVRGIEDMMHLRFVNLINALQPYMEDKERYKKEVWDSASNLATTLDTAYKLADMRVKLAASLPTATDEQTVVSYNSLAAPAPVALKDEEETG